MKYDDNFDGQKLMYHPAAVAEWLGEGETRGPLYTEFELATTCNCRCSFCGVDHLVNKARHVIALEHARKILDELKAIGNRSVMFSGHGEPLLNPDAATIIRHSSSLMSTSLTTNGLKLDDELMELIDGLEWIRFSINGGTPDVYAQIQGTAPEHFDLAMDRVAAAAERKRRLGLDVVVGTQMVLLDENAGTVLELARRVKAGGADYFSVKPYSQHPLASQRDAVDYGRHATLADELRELDDAAFRTSFRILGMVRTGETKPYEKCYGTRFLCFVGADGNVWECNIFAGDDRFNIGNAITESMGAIWNGPRRRDVLAFIDEDLDIAQCRGLCRMDACNRYLWRLKHPRFHDNFI